MGNIFAENVVKSACFVDSMEQVGYVFTRRRNTMKARIPMISESKKKKLRSEIKVEVDKAWKQVEQEKEYDITRRVLKTIIYVLNTEYGYGIKRISRLFNSFTQMLENSKKDEVYWEHVDKVVIDFLKIPFERDYTDNGQVISESKLQEAKNG